MNIFKKIKEIFKRRKALNEIYDDLNNLDQVFLEKKLQIFNELITPRFAEIGLKNWNGKYLWFSDFNEEGIKHVVELMFLNILEVVFLMEIVTISYQPFLIKTKFLFIEQISQLKFCMTKDLRVGKKAMKIIVQ